MTAYTESAASFADDAGPVRARVRMPARVLAGGACRLVLVVETEGSPFFLAIGTDRMRGRRAPLEIAGMLDGTELPDPGAGQPSLGGPSGAVPVAPQTPYELPVLVNDFVRLELAVELLDPGAERPLQLTLTRPLPLARTPAQALNDPGAPVLTLQVTATVYRDDQALAAEIADLTAAVRAKWHEATSNDLEDALHTLVALRLPQARAALATLGDHPNPLVRAEAARC